MPNGSENRKVMKQNLKIESLTLVSAVNYEKLYREFGLTKMLIIDIGAVCAAVSIVVSILLPRYLTKPIVYLSKKVKD